MVGVINRSFGELEYFLFHDIMQNCDVVDVCQMFGSAAWGFGIRSVNERVRPPYANALSWT
jgi:hypothetical protein